MAKTQAIVNLIPELRGYIAREFKTQTVAAEKWGCSRAFLSAILKGKKNAPDWMLDLIGVERIKTVVYVRK